MTAYLWKPEFAIGEPEVDRQHQAFFAIISGLEQAIENHSVPELITRSMADIMEYAAYHFYAEESLMAASEYPGYEEHCKKHRVFARKTLQFADSFHAGGSAIAGELLAFCRHWLIHHILEEDQAIAAHLRSPELAWLCR